MLHFSFVNATQESKSCTTNCGVFGYNGYLTNITYDNVKYLANALVIGKAWCQRKSHIDPWYHLAVSLNLEGCDSSVRGMLDICWKHFAMMVR
jgi:hypothetical protein